MLKFKTTEGRTVIVNKDHIIAATQPFSSSGVHLTVYDNYDYYVTHIWSKQRNDWIEIDINRLYDWIG